MAPRRRHRPSAPQRFSAIALAVAIVSASISADAACDLARTAANEVTLRFGAECASNPAMLDRVKTDLLGAVSSMPSSGAPAVGKPRGGGAGGGGTRQARGSAFSPMTEARQRLYALDQIRFDREVWWRRTYLPLSYYDNKVR